MKCRKNFAQTDPCCNSNDYKYKPILNDSAPVNISETDKAIDFKCGTQLQTFYNTHKVTNFPTEEAWLKSFRHFVRFCLDAIAFLGLQEGRSSGL